MHIIIARGCWREDLKVDEALKTGGPLLKMMKPSYCMRNYNFQSLSTSLPLIFLPKVVQLCSQVFFNFLGENAYRTFRSVFPQFEGWRLKLFERESVFVLMWQSSCWFGNNSFIFLLKIFVESMLKYIYTLKIF